MTPKKTDCRGLRVLVMEVDDQKDVGVELGVVLKDREGWFQLVKSWIRGINGVCWLLR